MNAITPIATAPDYGVIKTKQNAAWSSGDYARIGVTLQLTGEELAEAANMTPGSTVLDVAAGNGNATMAFARRWCAVTSTDYVATLLESGRRRADAEGLDVTFKVADAENLPFDGRYVPPPAGMQSPALWGDRKWIAETFKPMARSISLKVKRFGFRYPSPQHFVDYFRTYYGPVHKAFLSLEEGRRKALNDDLLATIADFDIAEDATMHAPSDYAEIVIAKA